MLSGSSRSPSPTQKMHRSPFPPDVAPRMYSIRHGENILSIRRSGVDQFPEFLADLEERDPLLGDRYLLPGLGITPFLGAPDADGETAETADLDLLPVLQGVLHVVEDRIHDHFAFLLRQGGHLLRQFLNEIALRHAAIPSGGLYCAR